MYIYFKSPFNSETNLDRISIYQFLNRANSFEDKLKTLKNYSIYRSEATTAWKGKCNTMKMSYFT